MTNNFISHRQAVRFPRHLGVFYRRLLLPNQIHSTPSCGIHLCTWHHLCTSTRHDQVIFWKRTKEYGIAIYIWLLLRYVYTTAGDSTILTMLELSDMTDSPYAVLTLPSRCQSSWLQWQHTFLFLVPFSFFGNLEISSYCSRDWDCIKTSLPCLTALMQEALFVL